MNEGNTFRRVTDAMLAKMVAGAEWRLVFIAPGVRMGVAKALAAAALRLPEGAVQIVLDADAEVCRLGYGELEGLKLLAATPGLAGRALNTQKGLRVGLVIADDRTLCYTPTPLLLEAPPLEDGPDAEGVNGVLLGDSVPDELADACAANDDYSAREIGLDAVDSKAIEKAEESLAEAPPRPFDLARQERVFSAGICFVELEYEGVKIASKTAAVPSDWFVAQAHTAKRLSSRFKAFDEADLPRNVKWKLPNGEEMEITELAIRQAIAVLRQRYLISTGEWGTVIRRKDLAAFKAEACQLEEMLCFYWSKVQKCCGEAIFRSCKALVEERKEFLWRFRPPTLWHLLTSGDSNEEKVDAIAAELAMQVEGELFEGKGPKMRLTEKDVCYSTFSNPKFIKALERADALGDGWLRKYFEEHNVVREKNQTDNK